MPKKIAFKLGYESPFTVYSVFSTQKDYRLAWLINQHLEIELKRIGDYSHSFSENKAGTFSLFHFHYEAYRMQLFLLGNKCSEGSIISENPVPDFLILFWNLSGFYDLKEFQKGMRKIQQVQTIAALSEKAQHKYEDFFYSLEYFLTEQRVI